MVSKENSHERHGREEKRACEMEVLDGFPLSRDLGSSFSDDHVCRVQPFHWVWPTAAAHKQETFAIAVWELRQREQRDASAPSCS